MPAGSDVVQLACFNGLHLGAQLPGEEGVHGDAVYGVGRRERRATFRSAG
jgi:hypothetical protein